MVHSWRYMGSANENPMGVEALGMFIGLGFVLTFGYWCTNYLVVQRAMAAKSMADARKTPLVGAFPKMLLPFIVIIPGVAAVGSEHDCRIGLHFTAEASGGPDYDQVLTTLMAKFYPSGMLGFGLTALMASLCPAWPATSPRSTRC